MQVGRVVFILSEEESNDLLTVLESVSMCDLDNQDIKRASYLKDNLTSSKKVVFIDDIRLDKIDTLPQ